MNEHLKLATELVCRPWLIPAHVHESICASVASQTAPAQPSRQSFEVRDRVAVIRVEGVLARYDSPWTTNVADIRRQIEVAADDPEIDALMLAVDSPGGSVMGTPEAAKALRLVRDVKPVMAYVDGFCDSGAYWLASQASTIYATESADVGCIGCYMAILDQTRALDMAGLKVEIFKSGKFKAMGFPGNSLTDEQRTMLQSDVDRIADQFKAAVRSGRVKPISDEAMQGQSFSADQAKSIGLIDQVASASTALRDAAWLGRNSQK